MNCTDVFKGIVPKADLINKIITQDTNVRRLITLKAYIKPVLVNLYKNVGGKCMTVHI